MKKTLLLFCFQFLIVSLAGAQTLLHYWNFNNSATEATLLAPSTSTISGASITHNSGANSGGFVSTIMITSNTTGQGFEVTNPNTRNADPAGAHLRFNNPIGGNLVFALPTTGYKDVVVKYATRRSGQGAHNQVVDYSLNGTTFTNLTTLQPVDANPTLQTLDFTAITGASNNPNFKIRISFTQGGGGLEGNNRFDNFSLEGNPAAVNTLLHYWNFNDAASQTALLTPNVSVISGSSIAYTAGGTSLIEIPGTGQNFDVANVNARNNDVAGNHLRLNNPIGATLVFALPTTNASNIVVKFATRRSAQGAGTQVVEYSTNGTVYIPFSTISPVDGNPTLQTLDFSSIPAVNNNANFRIRITFQLTGGGTGGNNRFDNFSVDGDYSGGSVITPPPPPPPPPVGTIAFQDRFVSVREDAGSVSVRLLLTNPAASTVKLVLKANPFSNTDASDITYATQTLTFTGTSATTQTVTIPVTNDVASESDEYFVLSLEDLSGLTLTGKQYLTVYIKDDDRKAPVATEEIKLNYISSFKPNTTTGSTTEIVVHDPASQRLFMTSAIQDRLDIADFSNPAAIRLIRSIDMLPYGGITSVAVRNGIVAVASPAAIEQQDGSVVFFNTNGDFQTKVTVGALPDMITFTPDGRKVITANEGQPNDAYTVDPEGSVSVIDISGGIGSVDQSKVTTMLFTSFNSQQAALISSGIRKTKASSTLSQDFEPEFVTVSADSKKAWVTLQENNAIAEINLETNTYNSIWPLGKKDFSNGASGLDASDNSGVIHISNYPLKSFFMPDGIASFSANGKNYLVSANEGDEKEYTGLNERTTVSAVTLDPSVFPNGDVLKEDHNLGRLRITNLNGDIDGDGDYDELIMNGPRSFSIWDADTRTLVYDSKDDFELYISKHPQFAAIFNADNEGFALKSRSRAKGPESEGVTVATINGATYAFITLERVGGVIVYNITNPLQPKLVDYKNNRSTTSLTGDLGPEGIIYIRKEDSPTGRAYITIANEISGNISVFSILEQDQTVAFSAIPNKTFGDVPFTPAASSNTGASPVFTSANPAIAVVENGAIRITGAGSALITATFPASGGFQSTAITQTLTVDKKVLTITADNKTRLFAEANPAFTATYSGFVNGNTSAVLTTAPAFTTTASTTSNVGTYPISGSGAAAANYSFVYVNGTLTVNKANQVITFAAIPNQARGGTAYTLQATSSSGLAISFANSTPLVVTLNGNQLRPIRIGKSLITASQAGNDNYLPAAAVTQEVRVNGTEGELVRIHGALSPDGDGINDFLIIEGVQLYPDNQVLIMNRAGVKVFEDKFYDNQYHVFRGTNKNGDLLPAGTYYCLLIYNANGETKRKTSYFVIRY